MFLQILKKSMQIPFSIYFMVCAQRKVPEKYFKICHIFGIRKPKRFFYFYISSNFGFLTVDPAKLCQHIDSHLLLQIQSCSKWKMKETFWVFLFQKYGNMFH